MLSLTQHCPLHVNKRLFPPPDGAVAGAPAWGLAIYHAVTALREEIQARTFNVSAERADDLILWPQHGGVPVPAAAPDTVEGLRSLGLEPCGALLAYYGLPVGDTDVALCRCALARHIGLPRGSM